MILQHTHRRNKMSNKNFGNRKKTQSFRPSGGMRNKTLKQESAEKGREDIENSRLLNEPVYERSREAEILKAENKAFGIAEKQKYKTNEVKEPIQSEKKKEKGKEETTEKRKRKGEEEEKKG